MRFAYKLVHNSRVSVGPLPVSSAASACAMDFLLMHNSLLIAHLAYKRMISSCGDVGTCPSQHGSTVIHCNYCAVLIVTLIDISGGMLGVLLVDSYMNQGAASVGGRTLKSIG